MRPPHPDEEQHCAEELREEIGWFERRLEEIGFAGDCAYERALSQTYSTLLEERRAALGKLTTPPLLPKSTSPRRSPHEWR